MLSEKLLLYQHIYTINTVLLYFKAHPTATTISSRSIINVLFKDILYKPFFSFLLQDVVIKVNLIHILIFGRFNQIRILAFLETYSGLPFDKNASGW